jgi:CheY-like chemotaxis protein
MSESRLAMVIEDDFDASVIFAKALEVLGFQTEVISSGEKAAERLKAVVPEIVLLDLHLPEIMGTSILRQIRADERLSQTLIIVATADPRSADLIQDDADLVLIKPTTFSQVRDLAARLTRSRIIHPVAATEPETVEKKEEAASQPSAETPSIEAKAGDPPLEKPDEKKEAPDPSPAPGTPPG